MQHYGLPTRLLDWSKSLLVALFFSTRSAVDEDGCVWALNPRLLNDMQGFRDTVYSIESDAIYPLLKAAITDKNIVTVQHKNYDYKGKVMACRSTEKDLRLFAQQAEFTVHESEKPLEEFDNIDDALIKFIIPSKLKSEILKQLEICGITPSVLFPDMEHIAMELKAGIYDIRDVYK
jgi:hypothetical protein